MADLASIFKPAAGARPRLACEIRPDGVVAARASSEHGAGETVMAFAPLPDGALLPGLKVPNFADRAAVAKAIETALEGVSARSRELTVVVPDAAVRVLLLDFDTLPTRRQDALPVVRFRLRKMVPFDVENAAVGYQVMTHGAGPTSVLVTVMPSDVLAEYEEAVHEAGYNPGAVLPSTLAAAAALSQSESALVVNQNSRSVTTAVVQGEEMLLHRFVDLPADPAVREEEIAQAVITALAWYEDTLRATPAVLHFAGTGGAADAARSRWLSFVNPAPPLEDLGSSLAATRMTSIPLGITAGVTGALAS